MKPNRIYNKYLNNVLSSSTFARSTVSCELLKILADRSLKGESITEIEIEYTLFGKNKSDKRERNVRIYVHNLRKRLADYYIKEGKDDEVTISIPKGAYDLDFKLNRQIIIKRKIASMGPYLVLIGLLLFIGSIFVAKSNRGSQELRGFIWNEFRDSPYSTTIILGDHYFFNGRNPMGGFGMMRLTNINNDKDFEQLLKESPSLRGEISKSNQTYINRQAPYGLYKVMTMLGGGFTDLNLKYSSDVRWEDIQKQNSIFIGSYKTQTILEDVHKQLGVEYDIAEASLIYTNSDSTSILKASREGFLNLEYASFIKFKTEDGRVILSFMCNSDVGNIAVLNYLSEIENLEYLEEQVDSLGEDNFKAIFEVKGVGRTDFELKLLRLNSINPQEINDIWP